MHKYNPRLAHWLALAAKTLISICLIANLIGWFIPEAAEIIARNITALNKEPIHLSTRALILGWMISTSQLGILTVGFWAMARVFNLFAQGDYLHISLGYYVQRFGKSLVWFALLSPFMRALMVIVITMDNQEGQRLLIINLLTNDLVILLVGLLLIMLGYALTEAALIAEENSQIV